MSLGVRRGLPAAKGERHFKATACLVYQLHVCPEREPRGYVAWFPSKGEAARERVI